MKGLNYWIKGSVLNKWFPHLLFWALSYYVLLHSFSQSKEVHDIDHIYTLLFHLTLLIPVYLNLQVLVPRWFSKEKYLTYLLSLVVVVVISGWINRLFFTYVVDLIIPDYYFIANFDLLELSKYFAAYIFITSTLKLSRDWLRLSENEKELALIREQKTQTELEALRSQLNPHFLFNSLNSLYALTLKKDDNSPKAILMLSDALRYVLYETNREWVGLDQELSFMQNYVNLQQLRMANCGQITFDFPEIKEGSYFIAPLLFLPLVENAFKYGMKEQRELANVSMCLKINDQSLTFRIENDVVFDDDEFNDDYRGIGLQNLKKRLALIYPGKHKLSIENNGEKFVAKLTLHL